ncbi:MAG: WecB/TagA/CpsF family glycosyltransferase [Phycisphaerae bacterium]|nr:WecB/TagA/CpsF family glycosyltransferase [Phycisphaerae bacterium]
MSLRQRCVSLFGIPFWAIRFEETLDALVELARGDEPSYVVTANVDHVVRFERRPEVRYLYLDADMVVADGMPLIWASKLVGRRLPQRVAGSDLFPALSARAAREGLSVFLLGGDPGTADRSAAILRARHPSLRIAGTYCPPMGFEKDADENGRIIEMIRAADVDILFVGLGSPKQEKWIAAHRNDYRARLSVGVGISFSFLCGDVVRAPRWLQRLGLEWAHRMFQEPGRLWRRYLVDDSRFAWLVLREMFKRSKQLDP